MIVTFSHHFDGADWTNQDAKVGEIRTGPAGLLRVLESRLGLSAPESHPAERIDAWMQRMEAITGPELWFHDSFTADRWSTAATVLRQRDELVKAGWTAGLALNASVRLAALDKVEAMQVPELPPGTADRLQAVAAELRALTEEIPEADIARRVLDIEQINLIEDWDSTDPAWQKLFEQLEPTGLAINRNQKHKSGIPSPSIDYHLLNAADDWEAAEAVATWLAGGDAQANEQVTILCSGDSAVLDAALHARGLPIVGNAAASPWRGALQLLPLLFANAWRPVDVDRLVELLSLDYGPVPPWAARRFLKALEQEPGVGGRAWDKAIADIRKRSTAYREERGETDAAEAAHREVTEMNRLLAGERFDPDSGIPGAAVAERCRVVVDRLSPKMSTDATAATAVGHARILSGLCENDSAIPRTTLERMIDSVVGHGITPEDIDQEAAPWRVATHPGEIVDPTGTVIWWDFTDPGVPRGTRWSKTERSALADHGVHLPVPETFHMREATAWRRPAAAAKAQLIMVRPHRSRGEEPQPHPWLDELRAAAQAEQQNRQTAVAHDEIVLAETTAAELFQKATFDFAGRRTTLHATNAYTDQEPDGRYDIPTDAIGRPTRLSYTSMNDLLGCPMKWALQNRAHIQPSGAASIPEINTMLGTLCHRIVELLYTESEGRVEPSRAEQRSVELFDSLVESMAARLLLSGREIERRRTRTMVGRAVRSLAEALDHLDLAVESTEEFLEVDTGDATLRGPADLIARDRRGRAFIIDMKWSGSARYKREEIKCGEALQLAVYSWMLKRKTAEAPGDAHTQTATDAQNATDAQTGANALSGSAYFMLAQGELLTTSPLAGADALESPADDEEIFERAFHSWKERISQMNRGVLEATGLTQAGMDGDPLRADYQARGGLYREPPCAFCDFGWLCGMEQDTV